MPGTVLLGSPGGSTGRRVPRGGGTVQFRILGPLEVLDGQRRVELGRPKQRALLAVLLVHANQVVALDRLIEELWGEQPPAQATASLQAYVSNLRRVLEPDRPARTLPRVLVTQPPGYRLAVAPGDLDGARFVALAEEGHRLLEAERPGPAAQVLREALGLWRGPALADVVEERFAQPERQRLEELRLVALEDRLTAELALGGHAAAAAELQQLVGRYPFRERLHGLLMLALYRAGRQAEALQAFQEARRVLGEELGIDPSRWLTQLERDILRQAPGLEWTAPPGEAGQPPSPEAAGPAVEVAAPATAPSPPAGEGELVGREEQLAVLDRTLAGVAAGRGRLVLVAGEPGIGKTRLAEEVARRAAMRGIQVAWGRCFEGEGAPAFWPWVQVARQLLAGVAPAQLGMVLGPSAGELSQLLPELKELVPGLEPPPVVELAAARFRLYQAVTELGRQVAAARPLLVVVDDLHWATPGRWGCWCSWPPSSGTLAWWCWAPTATWTWRPASRWPRRSARWPASRWWNASRSRASARPRSPALPPPSSAAGLVNGWCMRCTIAPRATRSSSPSWCGCSKAKATCMPMTRSPPRGERSQSGCETCSGGGWPGCRSRPTRSCWSPPRPAASSTWAWLRR